MIILTETTDKIQVVLDAAITTNQLQCFASYRDSTTTDFTPGRNGLDTNDTTPVDLIDSPAASTQRGVDFISIYNKDTAPAIVTITADFNGTPFILWKGSLAVSERVEYSNEGFRVFSSTGGLRTVESGNTPVVNQLNLVTLNSDVINNNAVANTIQDVTDLSFPVIAGQTYWFQFEIIYTAAATTTGSRWSVSGPGSPTRLIFTSEYSLTTTTTTRNATNTAYDLPAASNATSATTGSNRAFISGFIVPSSNGNVIARFASEVLSSAITAKAGSFVQWMRTQ